MSKSYSGQHIYTFVIGKRYTTFFGIIVSSVILWIAYLGVFSDSANLYSHIYSSCYNYFSSFNKASGNSNILNSLKPDIHTVVQTASPILYTTVSESDGMSHKKTDTDTSKTAQHVSSKISIPEKNINSENLSFKNETNYSFDLHLLSKTPITYTATGAEPRILILHTHACEAYSDENGRGTGEAGTYRSTSNHKNMIKAGKRLSDNLSTSGLSVIHDTTQCDYPSYNDAYKNSLGVAQWYISKYPSINFVFDIHRDAITDENNAPIKLTCDVNGTKTAQIMIVCGTDAMGLNHPNWMNNLTLAAKIQSYLEKNYPGIARPINIRRERFNMHTTPGSLIFEIGTHGNTMDEALRGVDILSQAIEHVLLNKA